MNLRKGISTGIYGLGVFLGSLFSCSEEPTPTPPTPVIEENIPLEITSSAISSVDEGRNYNYNVHAIGGNGSELTYLLKEKPSWLEIIASSGRISGKVPEVDKDTDYPVEVEVSDGESSVTQSYTLTAKDVYDIIVSSGESIQDAIDSADAGTRIAVKAGIYNERITINKPLTLLGATYDTSKRGYIVPADYAWNEDVESIIQPPEGFEDEINIKVIDTSDVSVKGFVIQALERGVSNTNHLFLVDTNNGIIKNINIENNIIGPNTNVVDNEDGNKGRMNIDLDAGNSGSSTRGIENSLIKGNKIFGAEGNGNNIFVFGLESAKGNHASYKGTIIEDNEIYGGHRSGIEISGGVEGLTIKNNSIYDNGGSTITGKPDIMFGNGIVIIRKSSDSHSDTIPGFSSKDLTITNNKIYDNQRNAIYMGPINENYTITKNEIYGNGLDGIHLDFTALYNNPDFEEGDRIPWADKTENITANYNNLLNKVRVIGAPTNGFVLNAKNNYWGTNSGGEIADMVSDYVDYEPWVNSEIWSIKLDNKIFCMP